MDRKRTMNRCVAPKEIEEWDLEAHIHGEARPQVARHLAQCVACRAQLAELQILDERLRSALARVDCPSVEELLIHRWNQLPPGRARRIEQHLASCGTCRKELASYAGPEENRASLRHESTSALARGLAVFVAILQPAPAMASALRGEGAEPTFYQVAENGWEIILTQAAIDTGYVLMGQLLTEDPAEVLGAQSGILAGESLLQETYLDDTGWFTLYASLAGAYTLWIETPHAHVCLPDVIIGPSQITS